MPIESSRRTDGADSRAGGWNDPASLGWLLFRRNELTRMSVAGARRQVAWLGREVLSGRDSLASEIHRRWRVDRSRMWFGIAPPLVLRYWGGFDAMRRHLVSTLDPTTALRAPASSGQGVRVFSAGARHASLTPADSMHDVSSASTAERHRVVFPDPSAPRSTVKLEAARWASGTSGVDVSPESPHGAGAEETAVDTVAARVDVPPASAPQPGRRAIARVARSVVTSGRETSPEAPWPLIQRSALVPLSAIRGGATFLVQAVREAPIIRAPSLQRIGRTVSWTSSGPLPFASVQRSARPSPTAVARRTVGDTARPYRVSPAARPDDETGDRHAVDVVARRAEVSDPRPAVDVEGGATRVITGREVRAGERIRAVARSWARPSPSGGGKADVVMPRATYEPSGPHLDRFRGVEGMPLARWRSRAATGSHPVSPAAGVSGSLQRDAGINRTTMTDVESLRPPRGSRATTVAASVVTGRTTAAFSLHEQRTSASADDRASVQDFAVGPDSPSVTSPRGVAMPVTAAPMAARTARRGPPVADGRPEAARMAASSVPLAVTLTRPSHVRMARTPGSIADVARLPWSVLVASGGAPSARSDEVIPRVEAALRVIATSEATPSPVTPMPPLSIRRLPVSVDAGGTIRPSHDIASDPALHSSSVRASRASEIPPSGGIELSPSTQPSAGLRPFAAPRPFAGIGMLAAPRRVAAVTAFPETDWFAGIQPFAQTWRLPASARFAIVEPGAAVHGPGVTALRSRSVWAPTGAPQSRVPTIAPQRNIPASTGSPAASWAPIMRWWHPAATDGDGVTAPAQPPAQQLVLVARAAAVADPRTTVVERLGAVLAEAPPPRPEQVNGRAVGIGGEPRAADMQSAMSTEPASLDALVDRAWQKLMQKVTIEQERRGYTRWPWQR